MFFHFSKNLLTFLNFEEKLVKSTEKFSKSTNEIAGNCLLTNDKTVFVNNNKKPRQKS